MVKEITAYQAEDGSVHATELAALEADTMKKLGKFDMFNHATRLAILSNTSDLVDALQPLANYIHRHYADVAPDAGKVD